MNTRVDFKEYKVIWRGVFQMAAWAAAIIAPFLTTPSQLALKQSTTPAIAFLQFIAAVGFAVVFSAREKIRSTSSREKRVRAICISAAVLVTLFFTYFFIKPHWTCDFANRFSLIIGNEYTPHAAGFIAQNPEFGAASCDKLLAVYAGNNFQIWQEGGIYWRYAVLTALYSVVWLIAVATIILVIEHVAASVVEKHRRAPAKTAAKVANKGG